MTPDQVHSFNDRGIVRLDGFHARGVAPVRQRVLDELRRLTGGKGLPRCMPERNWPLRPEELPWLLPGFVNKLSRRLGGKLARADAIIISCKSSADGLFVEGSSWLA